MDARHPDRRPETRPGRSGSERGPAAAPAAAERWQAPRFEVIALACEITAYAPDDTPLF